MLNTTSILNRRKFEIVICDLRLALPLAHFVTSEKKNSFHNFPLTAIHKNIASKNSTTNSNLVCWWHISHRILLTRSGLKVKKSFGHAIHLII